jgi:hypothetical protein
MGRLGRHGTPGIHKSHQTQRLWRSLRPVGAACGWSPRDDASRLTPWHGALCATRQAPFGWCVPCVRFVNRTRTTVGVDHQDLLSEKKIYHQELCYPTDVQLACPAASGIKRSREHTISIHPGRRTQSTESNRSEWLAGPRTHTICLLSINRPGLQHKVGQHCKQCSRGRPTDYKPKEIQIRSQYKIKLSIATMDLDSNCRCRK